MDTFVKRNETIYKIVRYDDSSLIFGISSDTECTSRLDLEYCTPSSIDEWNARKELLAIQDKQIQLRIDQHNQQKIQRQKFIDKASAYRKDNTIVVVTDGNLVEVVATGYLSKETDYQLIKYNLKHELADALYTMGIVYSGYFPGSHIPHTDYKAYTNIPDNVSVDYFQNVHSLSGIPVCVVKV
jgi:hypothetical protein